MHFALKAFFLSLAVLPYVVAQAKITHAALPGRGMAQHDFLYAGESKQRHIFLVQGGKITWRYDDPHDRGEISDAVRLSNGNILFARQFGVTEITPEKKIVWNYDVPEGSEVHTAVPIGLQRVLYIQNGPRPMVRVINIATDKVEREFSIPVGNPAKTHPQFRHARLTPDGTLLVAHMDMGKVVEYDAMGHELWSFPAEGAWGVSPLPDHHVLITDRKGVREVTRKGDTVWSISLSEVRDYGLENLQLAWRLPNGNTVLNNWNNEWNPPPSDPLAIVQAIEVTPQKEVVWALRSWTPPNNLGPATTFQFLDSDPTPEQVHFGDIR